MNISLQKVASRAISFAHLAGIGRPAAKASEDDDDKPKDEDKKDAKGEGDEPEKKDDDKKDAKAEQDDDDPEAAADDKPDPDDDKKDAKAEGDDKDKDDDRDEEMRGKSAAAQARLREQARCAAIFASPAAARNPVLAAKLAFQTRMPRSEAVTLLEGTPAPAAGNPARSARNPSLGNGAPAPSRQQALASRWDQNLQAANPNRRSQ